MTRGFSPAVVALPLLPMFWAILADAVVGLHLAFVAFVVGGGLAVLRWPRLAWIHLPAAAWGVIVEIAGWVCPLTPLELALRARGGAEGYRGDFVGQYVLPVLYPENLTRPTQVVLGAFVIVVNVAVYGWMVGTRSRRAEGRRHR